MSLHGTLCVHPLYCTFFIILGMQHKFKLPCATVQIRACNIYIYYCTSGRAVQENIRFKAGSIGPTVGRANKDDENRIFSCTARPNECDNIFII